MGHMAKVINGVVIAVHSREPEYNATQPDAWAWIQTSYNVRGGVYYDNATGLPAPDQAAKIAEQDGRQRKNYAGIGYRYDIERDAFIPPQPYPSWKLNTDTCLWESPIPYPQDDKEYIWNEAEQEWTYMGYYINENNELVKEEV